MTYRYIYTSTAGILNYWAKIRSAYLPDRLCMRACVTTLWNVRIYIKNIKFVLSVNLLENVTVCKVYSLNSREWLIMMSEQNVGSEWRFKFISVIRAIENKKLVDLEYCITRSTVEVSWVDWGNNLYDIFCINNILDDSSITNDSYINSDIWHKWHKNYNYNCNICYT